MKRLPALALILAGLLGLLGLVPGPASAQTIAISGVVAPGVYSQQLYVPFASVFEIAVWIDPASIGSRGWEFGYTDLTQVSPGVLQVGVVTIIPVIILPPPCENGQCVFGSSVCFDGVSQLEIVRFQYIDVSGVSASDVVLTVGPAQPSSFGDAPGFIDCNSDLVPLTVGGTVGGVTGAGVVFPEGAMVVNPTPVVVPNSGPSLGRLKARFD
jgi:hypothetical protein